jgi:hypothetical protein
MKTVHWNKRLLSRSWPSMYVHVFLYNNKKYIFTCNARQCLPETAWFRSFRKSDHKTYFRISEWRLLRRVGVSFHPVSVAVQNYIHWVWLHSYTFLSYIPNISHKNNWHSQAMLSYAVFSSGMELTRYFFSSFQLQRWLGTEDGALILAVMRTVISILNLNCWNSLL